MSGSTSKYLAVAGVFFASFGFASFFVADVVARFGFFVADVDAGFDPDFAGFPLRFSLGIVNLGPAA